MNDHQGFQDPIADLGEYPNSPGHRGVPTSVVAADDLAPRLGRLQAMVRSAIEAAGASGLTSDECADELGLDRWSCQPRLSELKAKGLIKDSGRRRRNRTRKLAIVWISADLPEAEQIAA